MFGDPRLNRPTGPRAIYTRPTPPQAGTTKETANREGPEGTERKKGREILLSHYKTCEQEKAESKGNEAASKIGVVSSRRSGVSSGVVSGASA